VFILNRNCNLQNSIASLEIQTRDNSLSTSAAICHWDVQVYLSISMKFILHLFKVTNHCNQRRSQPIPGRK